MTPEKYAKTESERMEGAKTAQSKTVYKANEPRGYPSGKEIEKGRNSDWSKEFFVRKKAEALESLNEQYMATTNAVEVKETVLEELNKQTEETIQTMVETEAQKEFMRYAFLKEPKTPIGKLVAGAWRKFKEWWDMHKRKEVEEKTRESVIGKLAELKKETKEHPRTPVVPKKHRETELE